MESGSSQAYRYLTVDDSFVTVQTNDAGVWYCIECRYAVGDWIEKQDPAQWEVIGLRYHARYKVREDLMSFMLLRGNSRFLYE